ncbi:hypothetical protein ACIRF8_15240 [Streptomyces sp. NPDC102406]|uniref:hypothetical protein n=1 Tax=Streptomyces sp. NPDC102406 TaxID=3366171 RepID=UPI0037F9AA7F
MTDESHDPAPTASPPAIQPSAPAAADLRERLWKIASRLAAHAKGFGDVLDESDRGPWGRLVRGDIDELRAVLAAFAPAAPFDVAAGMRRLAEDLHRSEDAPAPADLRERVASCPGHEMSPNPCRCPCYGCKHHCSAHNPDDALAEPATDLRERVAEALADADGWVWAESFDKTRSPSYQEYLRHADAVLAVPGVGGDCGCQLRWDEAAREAGELRDRAAKLDARAEELEATVQSLRADRADEAQQAATS